MLGNLKNFSVSVEPGTWTEGDCLVCNCTEDNRKMCGLTCNLTPEDCEKNGMILNESSEGWCLQCIDERVLLR